MNEAVSLATAFSVGYAYAVLNKPILQSVTARGAVVAKIAASLVLLCPLIVPQDQLILRAIVALVSTDLMFKMVEYSRVVHRTGELSWKEYLRFLVPFPPLLVVLRWRQRRRPCSSPATDWGRLILGGCGFGLGFVLIDWVSRYDIIQTNFWVDHGIKLLIFGWTIESAAQCCYGAERLLGYDTHPAIDRMFLSKTVAEFWWRYNNRVHMWLRENVFLPVGGRQSRTRGIFATFFVSAVHHEVMFAIATSRLDGYQFAFFMIQAPAVVLSPWAKRIANRMGAFGEATLWSLTLLWFYFTSMFFFHGVDRVFPFYYTSEPLLP